MRERVSNNVSTDHSGRRNFMEDVVYPIQAAVEGNLHYSVVVGLIKIKVIDCILYILHGTSIA